MASNTSKEAATEEVELQMTPMIDVTFLLLIFFMCSIKFKMLDGKLAAYLPRNVGVNATPVDQMLEKIDIEISVLTPSSPIRGPEQFVIGKHGIILEKGRRRAVFLSRSTEPFLPRAMPSSFRAALFSNCLFTINCEILMN